MNSAIVKLKELHLAENRRRFPSLPDYARTAPRYSQTTANGLTKMIIDYLKFNGQFAERIAVTGRYLDQTKTITDVLGRSRRIGSGKWIPPSMQPGSADISAVINGRAVKIEVKIGRDRQSDAQKRYQEQVEAAGAFYVIATDFESFYKWYQVTFPDDRVKTAAHEKK